MAKLTDVQINLIKKFAERFDCEFEDNGNLVTFEQAIAKFNGEQPKVKPIADRKKEFADTIRPYITKYTKEMLNKFYKYWCKEEGYKMKFEKQTSWNLDQRLAKWYQNDLEYERQRYIQQLNNRL